MRCATLPIFTTLLLAGSAFHAWAASSDTATTAQPPTAKQAEGPVVSIEKICGSYRHGYANPFILNEVAGIYNTGKAIDRRLTRPKVRDAARLRTRRQQLMARLLELSDRNLIDFTTQLCLARTLLSFSESQKALVAAERAVRLAPEETRPLILRAIAHMNLGQRKSAARDAAEVLRKSPDNKGAADLYWRATGKHFVKKP